MSPFGDLQTIGNDENVFAVTFDPTSFDFSLALAGRHPDRGYPRASFYYFLMVFVVIGYKTKATAGRALAFIVRIFVNDTIAVAVWTSFHATAV
jgi:hypothetical protein